MPKRARGDARTMPYPAPEQSPSLPLDGRTALDAGAVVAAARARLDAVEADLARLTAEAVLLRRIVAVTEPDETPDNVVPLFPKQVA
jgi:hypothetical protein